MMPGHGVRRSSKGPVNVRCCRQELHRSDREYRFRLSEQQSDAGFRDTEPDQPDSRGLAAGFDGPDRGAARACQAGGVAEEIGDARLPGVSGGRQTLQVAEAASAHAIQHDAGAIPREMGAASGLSDGGAELCGGAFAAREENGARATAPAAEISKARGGNNKSRGANNARAVRKRSPAPGAHPSE